MELILETVETAVYFRFHSDGNALRSALEEHAVHVPDILGCFPEAEGGMYPGYLRNYGEAGFPKVHHGAESRVVVPLDGGGP